MMAVELHNSELLIPSQYYSDNLSLQNSNNKDRLLFGSSEPGSELSSHIDSDQQSSSFTESSEEEEEEEEEEEDCSIGELTRKMAQYMLQDEDNKHEKSSHMAVEFENMKIKEEKARHNHGGELKQALIDDKIRAIQFYKLIQKQAMKQMEQKARVNNYQKVALNSNITTPWYTLQQQSNKQTGSDMRSVFLNGSGSRNGSCGTGVFLPRGAGITSKCNSRKKQGCATVMIPARVVQALNLHFEKTGVPSRFSTTTTTTGFNGTQDGSESGRRGTNASQKGRSEASEPAMNHHEDLSLPQEWTY